MRGITHIQEGQIVAIPKIVKGLVSDKDGIGVFTTSPRLDRY